MKFKEQVEKNIWHDREDLQKTLDVLKELSAKDSTWSWSKNPKWRAKYVDIHIDMRDGAFVLMDREGERISLEEILAQDE